ncbi:acetylornithine deacetylase [Fodinicurvata halophila]|uniref:Acetylornithine deacetylase n=1 Tax=Fodinicurvata halophila TaxID=1419723 RepID=A0ABV8UJY5_9PROT
MSDIRLESRRMIERLISHDTTSRNSNLDLISFIADYLSELGVESELVHSPDQRKANLYATLGPADRGGIALSGHTDVVPIDGQDWSQDPWSLTERDGRLYGRGTCDMKSFVALCLVYAPEFLKHARNLPVHFCFTYDEEIGCVGVGPLLDHLARKEIRPRCAIIGEPTGMHVVNAHKGRLGFKCHVRGHECHSSLAPQGVNAIQYAARLINRLVEMGRLKAEQGPFDHDYDIPFSTVHVGTIEGGTAVNIVPRDCSFEFEFRCLPGDDPRLLFNDLKGYADKELEPEMQAIAAETGITFVQGATFAGLDTPDDHEVVTLAKSLAEMNSTAKVAFGTEAGQIAARDIPAVVCGPGFIEQAHKPDEFISLEQVARGEAFMERLLKKLDDAPTTS